MINNRNLPSLLPYIEPGGSSFCLRISLNTECAASVGARHFPFVLISESSPFTRIVDARIVSDSGSTVKRVFLLLQKDEYQLPDTYFLPINNQDIEKSWQKTFSLSDETQKDPIISLAAQVGEDARLLPFQSFFYCKTRKLFFHPPCPRCGQILQQCYDDDLLTSLNLQLYSSSLRRYLYCPACHNSEGEADFYAFSLHNTDPPQVRDQFSLIKDFGKLTDDQAHSQRFICAKCPNWNECYGSAELAASRIIPFSFYPFYLLMFEAGSINADDFLALLSGCSFAELQNRLKRHAQLGRMLYLESLQQSCGASSPLLFQQEERVFLEVLYLKLTFLGELSRKIFAGLETYAYPDLGFSLERIWVNLAQQNSLLPLFWNFSLNHIDVAEPIDNTQCLPTLPTGYGYYILGSWWFYGLLINQRQSYSQVNSAINQVIRQHQANNEIAIAECIPNEYKEFFEAHNVFWDPNTKQIHDGWIELWQKSLALGWSLLQNGLHGTTEAATDIFWQEYEKLRHEIASVLFAQGVSVDSADSAEDDTAIRNILADIKDKWTVALETVQAEDSLEETVIIPKEEKEYAEKTPIEIQDDQDIQETVILPSGQIPPTLQTTIQSSEEDICETVIISPQATPGQQQSPEEKAQDDIPETVIISASENKNTFNRAKHESPSEETQTNSHETNPGPTVPAADSQDEDILAETVILQPPKKDDY